MFLGLLVSTFIALAPVNTPYPAVLDCIVQHESGGKQFRADGSPLVSPTGDVGVMQIHLARWAPTAKTMGLDIIHSAKDNIEFGIWLYNKYGPTQWSTYKKYCLGNNSA